MASAVTTSMIHDYECCGSCCCCFNSREQVQRSSLPKLKSSQVGNWRAFAQASLFAFRLKAYCDMNAGLGWLMGSLSRLALVCVLNDAWPAFMVHVSRAYVHSPKTKTKAWMLQIRREAADKNKRKSGLQSKRTFRNKCLERVCLFNRALTGKKSCTAELSPPTVGLPHVTTESSCRVTAKRTSYAAAANISWRGFLLDTVWTQQMKWRCLEENLGTNAYQIHATHVLVQ